MAEFSGHRARKRFGQNFLHDARVIARIVQAAAPRPGQSLVEIGPGQGALTGALLREAGSLTAIEIDRDLAASLRARFGHAPGFHLLEQDVLKVDFATLAQTHASLRIVGNLPYNISTPLLFHLLRYQALIADMLFMLQLEVVQRMAAPVGSPDYGRLSVMLQYHCRVEQLFEVPPEAFTPRPKVRSALVRLSPLRPRPVQALSEDALALVVRSAFNQRRKTLRNALGGLFTAEQMRAEGIDPGLRPENLGLADYVKLADLVASQSQPRA